METKIEILDHQSADLEIEFDFPEEWQGELDDLNKEIELSPEMIKGYFSRAMLYRKCGQPSQAIKDYTRVIELEPDNARAYYGRSRVYTDLGQIEFAFEDYKKAIKLEPLLDDDIARRI